MRTAARQGRYQCCGGRARTDHHHTLTGQVEVSRPLLRVDDATGKVIHTGPFRRVTRGVTVVTLAHP